MHGMFASSFYVSDTYKGEKKKQGPGLPKSKRA